MWVNGRFIGEHRGRIRPVHVRHWLGASRRAEPGDCGRRVSPTDAGTQPRGKQVREPGGIWYTPTSGIWQTSGSSRSVGRLHGPGRVRNQTSSDSELHVRTPREWSAAERTQVRAHVSPGASLLADGRRAIRGRRRRDRARPACSPTPSCSARRRTLPLRPPKLVLHSADVGYDSGRRATSACAPSRSARTERRPRASL